MSRYVICTNHAITALHGSNEGWVAWLQGNPLYGHGVTEVEAIKRLIDMLQEYGTYD